MMQVLREALWWHVDFG